LGGLLSSFSFVVGDETSISFWHNQWNEDGILKDLFPSLYVLAQDREASVADYQVLGTGSTVWRPIFVRDSFDDDDTLVSFFSKLSETNPDGNISDKVRWKLESKGCFTVKSFYLKLLSLDSREAMSAKSFPYHIIWRTWAPVKVSFFVWEVSHGKILTSDNLHRRGFTLANRCFLCKDDSETVDHLLLHCKIAGAL